MPTNVDANHERVQVSPVEQKSVDKPWQGYLDGGRPILVYSKGSKTCEAGDHNDRILGFVKLRAFHVVEVSTLAVLGH